jgi:FkbM family methyltransferase
MSLDPAQAVDGGLLFYPHLFNRGEFGWMRELLRPEDKFVDAGAYIGAFSLVASEIAREVIALEASPIAFARLVENIKANGKKIQAVQTGVSDRSETLTFYVQNSGNLGGSSFVYKGNGRSFSIDCKPLSELAPGADFLKIDLEGMDLRVLQAYLPANRPRALILEAQPGSQIVELCQNNGYRLADKTIENVLMLRQ